MKLALLLVTVALARTAVGGMIKMRVDDELLAKVDCKTKANAFAIAGWQWTKVWNIPYDDGDQVLAFRMFDQGGGYFGVGEIDGQDLFKLGIKCTTYQPNQDPDTLFPNWCDPNFDDTTWKPALSTSYPHTSGIISSATGFWADPLVGSNDNVLCRVRIGGGRIKMRVDDELLAMVDCDVKANAFAIAGWQWTKVWEFTYPRDAQVLAFRLFDQGGGFFAAGTINGEDMFGYDVVCKSFDGGDPNIKFPGWCKGDYDDSGWLPAQSTAYPSTAGLTGIATGFWGQPLVGNNDNVICRIRLGGGRIKMRVDDELLAMVDCDVKANAFAIAGWQWTKVWDFQYGIGASVLAFRMFDQGGGFFGVGTIDGKDMFKRGIKCKSFAAGGNPDTLFPGWCQAGFDDSSWLPAAEKSFASTAEFNGIATGFWGQPAVGSTDNVVCRVRLNGGSVKIRVDDELLAKVDGRTVADAFKIAGWQWTTVWKFNYGPHDQVLAMRFFDQGGGFFAVGEINGVDMFSYNPVCVSFKPGQNPDQLYPGWANPNFDDSKWLPAVKKASYPSTAGIISSATAFWGNPDVGSNDNVLCRIRL